VHPRGIHIIEPTGRGGIFQHSVAVAEALHAAGVDVTLHTAADAEDIPANATWCRCVRWCRGSGNRIVRRLVTTAGFGARTVPHLARTIRRSDVVHLQGSFGLVPEIITVARAKRATVVASPHNTFARTGSAGASRALRDGLSRSDRVLVYSRYDLGVLTDIAAKVGVVPLAQWVPRPTPERVAAWRERFSRSAGPVALLIGQVRHDKQPDLFVRALAGLPGWTGAVVGEDLGPGQTLETLAAELGAPLLTDYRYLDLDDFTAAVMAADVVVTPYAVASQSGVLTVAAMLGVPTAAFATGGLSEVATAVAADQTPESLRAAIREAKERGATKQSGSETAELYLEQYAVARSAATR
jgi:glycosyltransferase involved in cell wall biosynthesis